MHTTTHRTPIGELTLAASQSGLVTSSFTPRPQLLRHATAQPWPTQAKAELDAYFAGDLKRFDVPTDLSHLSLFDQSVLRAIAEIPYGTTTTYGELTTALGLGLSDVRKVAGALARNPLPVVLPCHRVVGAKGKLTGYAGGIPAKRRLLDLENAQYALNLPLAS